MASDRTKVRKGAEPTLSKFVSKDRSLRLRQTHLPPSKERFRLLDPLPHPALGFFCNRDTQALAHHVPDNIVRKLRNLPEDGDVGR